MGLNANRTIVIIIAIIAMFLLKANCYAEWSSPIVVLSIPDKTPDNKNLIQEFDTTNAIPGLFGVDNADNIYLIDRNNNRILKYNHNNLISIITNSKSPYYPSSWPNFYLFHNSGHFYAEKPNIDGSISRCFYNSDGIVLACPMINYMNAYVNTNGYTFYLGDKKYYNYSLSGDFISIENSWPKIMGEEERDLKTEKVILRVCGTRIIFDEFIPSGAKLLEMSKIACGPNGNIYIHFQLHIYLYDHNGNFISKYCFIQSDDSTYYGDCFVNSKGELFNMFMNTNNDHIEVHKVTWN